jgi:hypothetical protein
MHTVVSHDGTVQLQKLGSEVRRSVGQAVVRGALGLSRAFEKSLSSAGLIQPMAKCDNCERESSGSPY